MRDTPETDALYEEHAAMRSNTLRYPTEQALLHKCKRLERRLRVAVEALTKISCNIHDARDVAREALRQIEGMK